jgi:hypothetical protein
MGELKGKKTNLLVSFSLILQQSFLHIYKRVKSIKIDYLNIYFFISIIFINVFLKKPKVLILNILKYKWVIKMIFSLKHK